jgi:30S ribosomal protein S31
LILKKYSIKIKNLINFASTLKSVLKLIKQIVMGKGDKKSRRGKIILGSYGVRRPRKGHEKPVVKPVKEIVVKEPKDKKPLKEKKEVAETKEIVEINEVKVQVKPKKAKAVKEKVEEPAPKVVKEKTEKETKPKKEKKS